MGQALFERLASQAGSVPSSWAAPGDLAFADTELFRAGPDGRRRARAVLVDTEPKVSRTRCMFGARLSGFARAAFEELTTKVYGRFGSIARRRAPATLSVTGML